MTSDRFFKAEVARGLCVESRFQTISLILLLSNPPHPSHPQLC